MKEKLFNYPGAKTAVAPQIINYFPQNYQNLIWVEAFGGSGILTYMKKPSSIEVFNDLDEGVSAIFYCLLFEFDALAWKLQEYAQHSETLLKWINNEEHIPKTIIDKATFEDPHQYPEGIKYVIINGKIVIFDQEHTNSLPGKVLRGTGYKIAS